MAELEYEEVVRWFDHYFADVNTHQGTPDVVAGLAQYFTPDFEFVMYTPPPFFSGTLSRQGLLMLFVHPGLTEYLTPRYYVVDTKQNKVVVQFEGRFVEEETGRTWAFEASAHYQLVVDDAGGVKIGKIQYWTESNKPEDDFPALFEAWAAARNRGLTEYAARNF